MTIAIGEIVILILFTIGIKKYVIQKINHPTVEASCPKYVTVSKNLFKLIKWLYCQYINNSSIKLVKQSLRMNITAEPQIVDEILKNLKYYVNAINGKYH